MTSEELMWSKALGCEVTVTSEKVDPEQLRKDCESLGVPRTLSELYAEPAVDK